MSSKRVHVFVSWSYMTVVRVPTLLATCPPATRIFPSGSSVCPEQKMFNSSFGAGVALFVAGSKIWGKSAFSS